MAGDHSDLRPFAFMVDSRPAICPTRIENDAVFRAAPQNHIAGQEKAALKPQFTFQDPVNQIFFPRFQTWSTNTFPKSQPATQQTKSAPSKFFPKISITDHASKQQVNSAQAAPAKNCIKYDPFDKISDEN